MKARVRIHLRAWRYARARRRLVDRELIQWAQSLLGR